RRCAEKFPPAAGDPEFPAQRSCTDRKAAGGCAMIIRQLLTAAVLLAVPAALAACSLYRDTEPPRTATEQLLISSAADRMGINLGSNMQPGTKVFVDPSLVEGLDTKYTIGVIRDRLMKAGGRMVAKKEDADIVVEPRIGAQSIDQDGVLVGIPSFSVPIPLST